MKKAIAVLVALALIFPLMKTAFGQEQIEAPDLKAGDFWQFKVSDRAGNGVTQVSGIIPNGIYVIRRSNRLEAFQIVGNDEVILERPGVLYFLIGRARRQTGPTRETANSQELTFPLFAGKKWQYPYEQQSRGTKHRTVHIHAVGRENIETPAGKFNAFRLEKQISWPIASALRGTKVETVKAVYFYSPETKSIIKYNSEADDGAQRDIELIKFGSGNNNQ
jgi:hypothetical protein